MVPIGSLADVAEIEKTPVTARLPAGNLYAALAKVAKATPDKAAIHFLPTGSVDDVPVTLTYKDFFGRITQTANLLHSLGVEPGDVVSSRLSSPISTSSSGQSTAYWQESPACCSACSSASAPTASAR